MVLNHLMGVTIIILLRIIPKKSNDKPYLNIVDENNGDYKKLHLWNRL